MSVFAPALTYYWKSAEEIGLDPEKIFRDAGIDPRKRLDTNARISEEQFDNLAWAARQASHDDDFTFHIVKNLHPSYLGALGYAWMTSSTLEKAFERLSRYYRLLTGIVQIGIKKDEKSLLVTFEAQTEKYKDPDLRERLRIAGAVQMCRMVSGDSFAPQKVFFHQKVPGNAQSYYEFFRCEQVFEQDMTALAISRAVAEEPLPGFNPQIVQHFDHMILESLTRMDRSDIVDRVNAAIHELLPAGEATAENVASQLNLSPRTLSRKLGERQESFKGILARIRRELAEKYIQDNSLSLTEISFLLGFSEVSSFSRAFRGWSGSSPSSHREALFGSE